MSKSQIEKFVIASTGLIPRSASISNQNSLPANDEILICEKWLREYAKPCSKIMECESSYALKHRVEEWAKIYVSNGAFIKAAVNLGYRIKVIDNGPNAYFGIKLFTPDEKWKHVRPTGFSKWLFKRKDWDDLAGDAVFDETWPRRAKEFINFWDYLNSSNVDECVLDALCTAWEVYSGEKAPYPSPEIVADCERFYDLDEDLCDQIIYGDKYPNAPDGTTYIYALFQEEKRKVRYVGQTVNPSLKLRQHITSPGTIDKVKWIGELLNKDCYPRMVIMKCVPISKASILKQAYIYAFEDFERDMGQKRGEVLLNN